MSIVAWLADLSARSRVNFQEVVLIRSAVMSDVPHLHRLINYHAEFNRMLHRSHAHLYEHLRDFLVYVEQTDGTEQVLGCVALESVWNNLAEIKSLAVDESFRGHGIGSQLVRRAIEEAARLGIGKIFVLTREERFFQRLGFKTVPKDTLPHKVWTDCVRCPLQDNCDEIAMVYP